MGKVLRCLMIKPVLCTSVRADVKQETVPQKEHPAHNPGPPPRVDLDLSLLRAEIDIEIKNRLLDEHLKWCFESDRVRFYPESMYVFAD